MIRKILIPTDGSPAATEASLAGITFAGEIKAEVIGIFVAHELQYPVYVGVLTPSYPSEEDHELTMRKTGEVYLAPLQKMADDIGITFSSITVLSHATADKIVEAAQKIGCDMIFMGSHGRSGWQQFLLGSVSAKVLHLCQVPTLIYRKKSQDIAHEQVKI